MTTKLADDVEDLALLAAWQAGDRKSGAELLRRHFAMLTRFFRHRAGEAAADLIQETMLRCAACRDRVSEAIPFRVYLLGIARRTLIDHLRRQGRGQRDVELAAPPPAPSPSGVVSARQVQKILLAALRRLPVDMQLTLELHYWEGLRVHEVAAVHGVALGTVKSRMARAKEMLRAHVALLLASDSAVPWRDARTTDDFDRWVRSLRAIAARDATPATA
jgi:RNA polymerase sigma-70 factor (ECF subfamily)